MFTLSIYSTLKTYVCTMIGRNLNHSLYFMNSKKAAGICFPPPTESIVISREYMNSKQVNEYDIYNTLLHELTHAAVGCHHGHNEVWQKSFRLLGGDGKRCASKRIDDEFYKYTIFCANGCKWNRERLHEKVWSAKYCKYHKSPLIIIKRN